MKDEREPTRLEKLLRERLLRLGVTQKQIEAGAGVRQATVSRFLRGETTLKMSTFEALNAYAAKAEELDAAGLLEKREGRAAARGLYPPKKVEEVREAA